MFLVFVCWGFEHTDEISPTWCFFPFHHRAYSKIYGTLERDYVPLFLASNQVGTTCTNVSTVYCIVPLSTVYHPSPPLPPPPPPPPPPWSKTLSPSSSIVSQKCLPLAQFMCVLSIKCYVVSCWRGCAAGVVHVVQVPTTM